jgi:thiol-disulfide isomerase/thioredoxin
MKGYLTFLILFISSLNVGLANNPGISNYIKVNKKTISNNRSIVSIAETDSTKLKIVENYSKINTISELLDCFKGKPVFIDLWATWCTPCIQEFAFSKPLKEFLDHNQVEMTFVSFDKDSSTLLWKNTIHKFKLVGNHVLANKNLRDSLTTLIWGGVDAYSIPHYLLFDKNKNLIIKSASQPSLQSILYTEIELALKQP